MNKIYTAETDIKEENFRNSSSDFVNSVIEIPVLTKILLSIQWEPYRIAWVGKSLKNRIIKIEKIIAEQSLSGFELKDMTELLKSYRLLLMCFESNYPQLK